MLNINIPGERSISDWFALRSGNSRAMQCPAPYPDGRFFVSQAQGTGTEHVCITENDPTVPTHKRLRQMRILKGGHGSTIAAVEIDGQPWILANAWGKLRAVKFRNGDVTPSSPDIKPYAPGWSYAYIDHESQTVCLRKGNRFELREHRGAGVLGVKVGAADKDLTGPGPAQGYCSMQWNGQFYLFTMWDYGRITSKPTVVVGSLKTGSKLYSINIRASLSSAYKRKEPEGGFGRTGKEGYPVFHLGLSLVKGGAKLGGALPFPVPLPDPGPPPPPVVTMTVRPAGDPIWTDPPPNFVTNRIGTGAFGTIERPSDYVMSGVVGPHPKLPGQFLKVGPNEYYRVDYLVEQAPE